MALLPAVPNLSQMILALDSCEEVLCIAASAHLAEQIDVVGKLAWIIGILIPQSFDTRRNSLQLEHLLVQILRLYVQLQA